MKTLVVSLSCLLLLFSGPAAAQEAPPLGEYHFAAELGAMLMQHVTFETDDGGLYIGASGYKHVGRSWYVGLAVAHGEALGFFTDDSDITMWELNGKRAFVLSRVFACDLGAGLSYNHVTYKNFSFLSSSSDVDVDKWVFGIQALANLHLKLGSFLLGANVEYMLTGDVPGVAEREGLEDGWDYSNLRFGFHVGFLIW
jgi:hypothetical protein